MRDHTKLRAFELADALAVSAYSATSFFPKHQLYGLTSQIRRAAISIACNIVEGCARRSEADFLRFLDMSYGSARELEYLISIARRLEYLPTEQADTIGAKCVETCKVVHGLIRSLQ